jgi:DNA-binding transcriptional LysR family regulator
MQEKLEFLLALAREKHFGRAAQVCGVSQPNLSAAIKQLETILGVPLVDRGARFLGFTPEGERVLEWARRIVGDFRSMHAEIETMKHGLTGHLTIASVPTALPVISRLTTAFWQHHAGVRLTIASHTSAEILSLLDNLEVDAGITYLDQEPIGRLAEVPLYHERYHLVTTRAGVFGGRPTVTWEEAATTPLCLLSPDMQNRRIIDRVFVGVGVTIEPILESSSIEVLASHLRTGRFSTILPKIMADDLALPADLASIPLVAPEISTLIGLVIARRDPQPPLTAALIAEVRLLAAALATA